MYTVSSFGHSCSDLRDIDAVGLKLTGEIILVSTVAIGPRTENKIFCLLFSQGLKFSENKIMRSVCPSV
jgi:hypothetical protein